MTILRDSSSFFIFSSLSFFEIGDEEEVEASFLAWAVDLILFLACWAIDLMVLFHLQYPWSFKASTTPTVVATTKVSRVAPAHIIIDVHLSLCLVYLSVVEGTMTKSMRWVRNESLLIYRRWGFCFCGETRDVMSGLGQVGSQRFFY